VQDECAWAIGNMAGGSAVCRDTLRAKGAVEPLIALLKVLVNLLFLTFWPYPDLLLIQSVDAVKCRYL